MSGVLDEIRNFEPLAMYKSTRYLTSWSYGFWKKKETLDICCQEKSIPHVYASVCTILVVRCASRFMHFPPIVIFATKKNLLHFRIRGFCSNISLSPLDSNISGFSLWWGHSTIHALVSSLGVVRAVGSSNSGQLWNHKKSSFGSMW